LWSYLGLDEGADIPYGSTPNAPSTHVAELKSLIEEFGERAVALQIGVSRNTLRRIVSGGNRPPSPRVLRRITAAIHALRSEASERRTASTRLREFAATEARKIGIAELARRLGADPSNLRKAINGAREFGLELEQEQFEAEHELFPMRFSMSIRRNFLRTVRDPGHRGVRLVPNA
jgi:transcriptional regulator with XRE-family HTH domain